MSVTINNWYEVAYGLPIGIDLESSMTLNDLERRNSPHSVFFSTEFDRFWGRLYHSGWRYTYKVRKILSHMQSSTFGENYNAPCSALSLQ